MKNKEEKKQLLSNGGYSRYCELRKRFYSFGEISETGYNLTENEIIYCEQMRHNRARQNKTLEHHISFLLSQKNSVVLFLTFTFNDDAMKLISLTRKRYIVRLLSKYFDDFIINIDYGTQNDREHYHAIASYKKCSLKPYKDDTKHIKFNELDNYTLGFYSVEVVKNDDKSIKKLSRYVSKLTLHSLKVHQTYVSCKKGTPYQYFKKLEEYNDEYRHHRMYINPKYLKFLDETNYIEILMNALIENTHDLEYIKTNFKVTFEDWKNFEKDDLPF